MAFGGLTVIDGLDLDVREGEIVSVIGPNGAGKTTLFNLVTGIYEPDRGDILFEGRSVVGLEPHQITQRGIARTFQTLRLFLNMTRARERDGGGVRPHAAPESSGRCCGRPASGVRSVRSASSPRGGSRSSAIG